MYRIRPALLPDAPGWAGVVVASSPHMVLDARSAEHELRTDPPGVRRLVAEVDGQVVAVAHRWAYPDQDHTSVTVMVRPERRRRGLGRTLLDLLLAPDNNGVESPARAVAVVEDDDGSRIACERWGFSITRRLQQARVDPRTIPDPGPPSNGLRIVTLADVGSEPVWRAHQRVARDDPSGLTLPMPWQDWQDGWSDPRARPDLGRAVLVEGELAAYTMIGSAGDRAWSDMTGTLPQHRGRGLALLAKQHALRAAAGDGITRAFTGNDAENRPMVAVNDRLGYLVVARPALAERRLR